MKILVYSNCPLDPSLGSGKTRVRFSEGLRARGHDVRVIAPDAMQLWPRLRAGQRFRLALGALLHLRRTLARETYDLVEINGGEFGWLARWLHSRRQRPLLVHRTDGCELLATVGRSLVPALHGALDRAAFRHVDGCVALCGADRDHLVQRDFLRPGQIIVVPPGLDDEFLPDCQPLDRPPRLVFLGSWIERKGIAALVPAVTAALQNHPALECDLLGTGRQEATLRSLFPRDLHNRVHGSERIDRNALAQRLRQASIFVLPTLYEGFGMATAEAMACGCAVVTTPTGFGNDLRHEIDALLVSAGNADALAGAIARLVRDPALRLRLARAGRERVQSMRWAESVARLEQTYRDWLNAHQ